jgi:hypothetical protein
VDCEKFETLLIDELYGELDEVTSAAVRRHAAGCARCGALLSGLRATRKVAAIPLEEPSIDLEDRILSAVREQQKVLPFRARAATVFSRAGAWAMRPQTAMAAVFLVVIGTSFVLVQSRNEKHAASIAPNAEGAPMALSKNSPAASAYVLDGNESAFAHGLEEKQDRLRGPTATPAATATTATLAAEANDERAKDKKEEIADNSITNASPVGGVRRDEDLDGHLDRASVSRGAGAGTGGGGSAGFEQHAQVQTQAPYASGNVSFGSAKQLYDRQQYDDARNQWDQLADASSQLWAGRAEKARNGCSAGAIQRFEGAAQRAGGAGTPVGNDALLEAARCYRSMNNSTLARARYSTLIGQGGAIAQTAQTELDAMSPVSAAHKAPAMRDASPSQPVTVPQATAASSARPQAPAAKTGASY